MVSGGVQDLRFFFVLTQPKSRNPVVLRVCLQIMLQSKNLKNASRRPFDGQLQSQSQSHCHCQWHVACVCHHHPQAVHLFNLSSWKVPCHGLWDVHAVRTIIEPSVAFSMVKRTAVRGTWVYVFSSAASPGDACSGTVLFYHSLCSSWKCCCDASLIR